jgi:hypothetical protein
MERRRRAACGYSEPGNVPRGSMDYLYSLYDALVSINVPNDKARAVVDAMERDMGTTIATKSDLQLLKQELVATLAGRDETSAIKSDLGVVRSELTVVRSELTVVRNELTLVRNEVVALVRNEVALVRKDMEILSTTMTVRLGSMLIVGLGLLFAALELT